MNAGGDSGGCLHPGCIDDSPVNIYKTRGVNNIIESSRDRGETEIKSHLTNLVDTHGRDVSCSMHKTCYKSYTSQQNRQWKKRKIDESCEVDENVMQIRRSRVSQIQSKCLFCGLNTDSFDPKHPDRRNVKVHQCVKGFNKRTILQLCSERNDDWGNEVALRCSGIDDLGAVEAVYHHGCLNVFKWKKKETQNDLAFQKLIDEMIAGRDRRTWNVGDLHGRYISFGGNLNRRQMLDNIILKLGDVVPFIGKVSIIGFKTFVADILNVYDTDTVDTTRIAPIVHTVQKEAHSMKTNSKVYNLGDFTYNKTVEQTSPTLLKLISKLISNGEITKRSISLSQALQYNINKRDNQTTLGLSVRFHHKYGSRQLIEDLHDHGFISTYDEARRFRKSCAHYVGNNAETLHQVMGLTEKSSLIFGWYDNFDIQVSTPNGRRETHIMATEFQLHPSIRKDDDLTISYGDLSIPKLQLKGTHTTRPGKSIQLIHYIGPKRINPPPPVNINKGIPYSDLLCRRDSLHAAKEKDTDWLNSLSKGNEAMEWNGYNNYLSREKGFKKPATPYMFGPMIDAPPAHPDTILTTLTYMKKSLSDMNMTYVHVTVDMQLYAITKQIVWSQPEYFNDVIVHPGGMHIIQSFVGCISKLMKGSGLEQYIKSAYCGVVGILNGKSWVKALRAYRGVAAGLLKRFFVRRNKDN